MLCMSFAGAAQTVGQAPTSNLVDITLKDADLVIATQALTAQTGIQFVIEPSSEEFKPITLSLNGVSAEEAIKYITMAAGAVYRRDESGVFIISMRKPGVTQETVQVNVQEELPLGRQPSVIRRISIVRGDPELIFQQLTGTVMFDPNSGFKKINAMRQIVGVDAKNQRDRRDTFRPGMYPMGSPLASFTAVDSQSASRPMTGAESGFDILLPGESNRQLAAPGGGGGAGRGGGAGFQGGGLQGGGGFAGGGLQGGGIGGGGGLGQGGGSVQFQPQEGNLVPQGTESVIYDPTTNSFIFKGTQEAFEQLQAIVDSLDVAPEQVEIKVEFITVTDIETRNFGMDWLYQRGTVSAGNTPGSFTSSDDPIFINYATGNLVTRLRAQLTQGGGKIVQAPIIRTLNNQPASVGSEVERGFLVEQVIVQNGVAVRAQTLEIFSAFTGLDVAPRINRDGTVTMFLAPQVQELEPVTIGAQTVPLTRTQFVQVVARVRDGETIVLGGLTRKADSRSVSRFPILGDLPIIGQFFQRRATSRDNAELLIFVTPRVIRDDTAPVIGP
jgi:general secretion pathway protein D